MGTGEIGDDAVASTAEDAAAMGCNALIEYGATGGQPPQRADPS